MTTTFAQRQVAMSPDGTRLAYVDVDHELALRALNRLETDIVPGTLEVESPFWSADGKWIGFFARGELKKVAVAGGPPVTICREPQTVRGAAWGKDNQIIYATFAGLNIVNAAGGESTPLLRPQPGETFSFPFVVPGSRYIGFSVLQTASTDAHVAAFDTQTGSVRILLPKATRASYVEGGYLLYAVDSTVMATRFDPARLETRGDPGVVADRVALRAAAAAEFSASPLGVLAYVLAPSGESSLVGRSLVWVDRAGRPLATLGLPHRAYQYPRLSPDGTQVAVSIIDQDIWLADLMRHSLTRLTFGTGADSLPVWTRDGTHVLFSSSRAGAPHVFAQRADGSGTAEQLTIDPVETAPWSTTRGGDVVVADGVANTLRLLHGAGRSRTPSGCWIRSPFTQKCRRTGDGSRSCRARKEGRSCSSVLSRMCSAANGRCRPIMARVPCGRAAATNSSTTTISPAASCR